MLTIGFLFIVSSALQSSSSLDKAISILLGNKQTRFKYFRLMFPVALMSAFLNNTPIVAALIPVVKNWCKRLNLPASKFLIPLSYAAILGGICTLIGTSTILVVHGLLLDRGLDGLSFFELTKISLPITILGIIFVSLIGHRFLPANKDPIVKLGENTREFVVEMKVSSNYPRLNQTVEKANLRHLHGLFLFQINRDGKEIAPVTPQEKILENDRLFFTGLPETIYQLQKTPGLIVVKDVEFNIKNMDSDKLSTYEAVISDNSPLIGQTVRESNFRGRYEAVILAIHRSGHRINQKVGDIVFKPGDTLFILAKKGFDKRWYYSKDFLLVSSSVGIYSKPNWKGNLSLFLLISMILFVTLEIVPMVLASAVVAVLMILLKIISPEDAKGAIGWSVLLIIACALGIGKAVENSGLASIVADVFIKPLDIFGPLGIIAGIFFITSIYKEIVTNNAAAAIMFPVALVTASQLNLPLRPLVLTLTIAAAAGFATPISCHPNLLVYGSGGYKFTDFLKIGIFMNLFVGIAVITIVYFMFF
jgi:di/tricarboxylate transporter